MRQLKITKQVTNRETASLDKYLQATQYGFRKKKSTTDAIHIIRRIAEYGQQTNNRLHYVLLDWEKAFDNFLAGLELGISKIPQIHVFQTLQEHTRWPTSLQKSMAEFCESTRGNLSVFP
mgnify:CR=1 FL=1